MTNPVFENAKKASGIHQHEINGNLYSIKLLPASVGLGVGTKLIKMFAPVIGIVADNSNEEKFVIPEDNNFFFEASTVLVNSMDEDSVVEMVRLLLADLSYNGVTVDFDTHFRSKYGELFAVLEVALKENFGDFLVSYLKAKGLEIPSFRELMRKRETTQEQQESE